MLKFKGSTLSLLLFVFFTLNLTNSLSLYKNKKSPLDVEVLNPSEFVVHLPELEKGTLVKFRVNINEDLSRSGAADFERDKAEGHTLRFSGKGLNLKAGDIIYYSGQFEDEDGYHGEDGSHIFNGVYKDSKRDRREVREERSLKDNSDEESDYESDTDSDIYPIETRFGHHRRRGHGRRHGHAHTHGHGPPYEHGPPHFGPPGPFGPTPFGPPPFHHGPGRWNGYGHGPRDKFGNSGPWDGHGGEDYGVYGEQFGMNNKPSNHKHDHFHEHHGSNNKKPWENGEKVNGNTGSDSNDNGNNEISNNFDNIKPNNGNSENNGLGNSNGSNSMNNNSGSNPATNNPKSDERNDVTVVTTVKISTVPNIDIRFSDVKDD